jgi:hypothetical protein
MWSMSPTHTLLLLTALAVAMLLAMRFGLTP